MLGCGYTPSAVDASVTEGNVWKEYAPGATTDQDASGNELPIVWSMTDYNRAVPGFNVAKLRDFILDASANDGVVTAQISIDSGRLSSTKQFTFSSTSRTAWQDASHWQGDPANDLSATATTSDYATGMALSDLVADFVAVGSDGEFRIVVDAGNKDVTGLNFTLDTTIEDVVATINAGLDAVPAACHCDYLKHPGAFRFTADVVGNGSSVVDVQDLAGGGTNIATAALLGDGANEIEHQAVDVTSPFTALFWWDTGLADPTNAKYFWSGGVAIRRAPKRDEFYGERAQLISVSISCTTIMTIYGYRIRYHVLDPIGAGVT